jgi:hypothetical protein
LRVPRRDRDVVQQAETHGAAGQRVVPGRAHEREAAALGRLEGAPGRKQRRLPARLGGDRVRIEECWDLERLEPVEVGGLVAAFYLFTRGGRSLDHVEGREERLEPLARLDVRLRRVEPCQGRVAYEVDRAGS